MLSISHALSTLYLGSIPSLIFLYSTLRSLYLSTTIISLLYNLSIYLPSPNTSSLLYLLHNQSFYSLFSFIWVLCIFNLSLPLCTPTQSALFPRSLILHFPFCSLLKRLQHRPCKQMVDRYVSVLILLIIK